MPDSIATWAEFYRDGGDLMHVILGLGIFGLLIILERTWRLLVGQRIDARRLMAVVQSELLAGNTEAALRACSAGRSDVVRVVRAGLREGVDPARSEAAVREQQRTFEPQIHKGLPTLSTIANLAMLVGLLGTIFGLIGGFRCGIVTSAAERQAALAREIAVAVHTSGFGILVGMLLLSARLVLVSAAERLLADIALCGARVVNLVRIIRAPVPSAGPPYR